MKDNAMKPSRIPVSRRRARSQGGWEILQFGLYAMFMVPLFLFTFINGMTTSTHPIRTAKVIPGDNLLCSLRAWSLGEIPLYH